MDNIAQTLVKNSLLGVTYRLNVADVSHIAAWYLSTGTLKRSLRSMLPTKTHQTKTQYSCEVYRVVTSLSEQLESFADGETIDLGKPDLKSTDIDAATS